MNYPPPTQSKQNRRGTPRIFNLPEPRIINVCLFVFCKYSMPSCGMHRIYKSVVECRQCKQIIGTPNNFDK